MGARNRQPLKQLVVPKNSGSATEGEAVDLSSTDYDPLTNGLGDTTRGVYIGGTGTLVVSLSDPSVKLTFLAVGAGTLLPICASKIYKTGTTATGLIALF